MSELPDIDGLWDYREPAATELRFREVLPHARASGDDAYLVELLTQLARAVCLQRRFAEAHSILDEAEPLLTAEMKRPRVRQLLERGRILNDTERAPEALRLFEEAWELAEAAGELPLAADALHMVAYVTRGEESVRWHHKAIEFCERHRHERFRRWHVTLLHNLADEFERLGDYASGRESVERALAISESLGATARVRDAKTSLARLSRLDGDVPGALVLIEELLRGDSPRGYVFEEYAECLLAQGREAEARAQFRRAHELLSKDPWYPPTEKRRLERIRRLGA